MGKKGIPFIGLDMFHYAILTSDESSGTEYEETVHIPNIVEAGFNPNSSNEVFFADNGPADSYSQIGAPEVTLNVGDLPPKDYATLMGASYKNGQIKYSVNASAPDVAIGYRRQKTNGEYRFIWFYKGKFSLPEESGQTKQDSVEFQTQEIVFTSVARVSDHEIFTRVDSDDDEVPNNINKATLTQEFFDDPNYEVPDAEPEPEE
ncbi:phage tail protein [Paenalkalicoccus suaedae]|uniref:Phage tail protein n=1 Tax=Paenalkalicoccus suaedae TaxID=2592382 RepID=A0A859FGX4_9BACI|nr:major tail protein [Paenalkalicoccus suaedae]QKS71904.1 phage tail protein [Paenalkalicoccus suaedae]